MVRKLIMIATLLIAGLSLTGFAVPASSMVEEEGNPWLLWVLVLVVLVAFVLFLVWWWMRGRTEGKEQEIALPAKSAAAATEGSVAEAPAEEGAEEPVRPPPAPDDLKQIEGIGPKLSSVLQAAGITTFAQLAEADTGQLEQILEEADPNLLRLAKPTTWPEQAKLAAEGKWEELAKLQDELHGGRRR
jgi:predicted flap endonuclease-1-like 5' DNA nuclease